MPACACFPASSASKKPLFRKAFPLAKITLDCWNFLIILGRPCGRACRCPRCCSPGIMRKLRHGASNKQEKSLPRAGRIYWIRNEDYEYVAENRARNRKETGG